MARFVRCIEGHAFDADVATACPVCGAGSPAISRNPAANDGPSATATSAAGPEATVVQPAAGRASPPIAIIAVALAALGIAGVVGYLTWFDDDPPPVKQQTAAAPAPAPTPPTPALLPAPVVAQEKPAAPPAAKSESAATKPPEDGKAGQSGTVWSQFSNLQGNASGQPPPPAAATTIAAPPKIALASLAPDDRETLNNKLSTLFIMFDLVRRVDARTNKALPWSGDGAPRSFVPRAQLEAAASAGKWSADAIAIGAWLDGWRAFVDDDPNTIAVMENALGLGSLLAPKHLGDMFMSGYKQFGADPVRAARWYEAAVALGNPDAAARLSVLYRDGNGVGADKERARKLYLMAVEGYSVFVRSTVEGAMRRRGDAVRQLASFGIKPEDLPANSVDLFRERRRFGQVPVARELLDRSIKGDRMAMNGLVNLITEKETFELDYRAAGRIAMEAGKRGQPNSMATYGYLISEGAPELAKPAEAPLWLFAAWSLDPKNNDLRELFRLSLQKLTPEQSQPITTYLTSVGTSVGLLNSDRQQRR